MAMSTSLSNGKQLLVIPPSGGKKTVIFHTIDPVTASRTKQQSRQTGAVVNGVVLATDDPVPVASEEARVHVALQESICQATVLLHIVNRGAGSLVSMSFRLLTLPLKRLRLTLWLTRSSTLHPPTPFHSWACN